MLLTVFGHIQGNQRVLIIKEELCKGLRQLGLSHTGRTSKYEGATGALGIFQARASASDGLGEHRNSLLLANNPLVKSLLHEHEASSLFLSQLEYRNSRRSGQNLSDDSFVNDAGSPGFATSPLFLQLETLAEESLLLVTQRRCFFEILPFNGRFLARANPGDFLVELAKLWWARENRQAQTRSGLVNEVNCLIWQETILDIAV